MNEFGKNFKLTLNEVFRYLYGGIFFYFSAKFFKINILKSGLPFGIDSTMGILLLLCLGSLVYILFRAICTPFMDSIHILFHRPIFGDVNRCMLRYVREHIISRNSHEVINVYRVIRDNEDFYETSKREQLHLQRSEVHLLYVSWFILFSLVVIKYIASHHLEAQFGIINILFMMFYIILNTAEYVEILFFALFFLFAGFALDMYICEQETIYVKIKKLEVIKFMNKFSSKVATSRWIWVWNKAKKFFLKIVRLRRKK